MCKTTNPPTGPQPPLVMKFTPASGPDVAVLTLGTAGESMDYAVREIPGFPGERAFQLTKIDDTDPAVYHLRLAEPGVIECDCPGGTYRGPNGCKHAKAMLQLVEQGTPLRVCRLCGDPVELPYLVHAVCGRDYDEWCARLTS